MFDVAEEAFGSHKKYWLIDTLTEAKVGCVPGVGGTITDMVLSTGKERVSVLAGYSSPKELQRYKGYKGAKLLPFPNRVDKGKFHFKGADFQLAINRPKEGCAIHGLVCQQPFHSERIMAGPNNATLDLYLDYEGDAEGYPFPFRVDLKYMLRPGGFKVMTTVTNIGKSPMPLGDGWHPYFHLEGKVDDWLLQLPDCRLLLLDKKKMPTGALLEYETYKSPKLIADSQLDIALFIVSGNDREVVSLSSAISGSTINIWQETGVSKYNFLQVYTPKDRSSIAIEPMTCAPNAFNNELGLIVLEPGERFEGQYGVFLS